MILRFGKPPAFLCAALLTVNLSCSSGTKLGQEGRVSNNLKLVHAKSNFPGSFPLVISSSQVAYYLTGPQQASPPDGFFWQGRPRKACLQGRQLLGG
jgi:hypothetical protein